MGANLPAAERFTPYGFSHQIMFALLLVGAWWLVRLGRAHAGTDAERRFGRMFAVAILAFTLPLQILSMTPERWHIGRSLPLQLCDLAWMAATYALWSQRRWAATLTYYWGLTLTTQAVLTPDLASPFPDPGYIMFWGTHLLVVWAAIYLTWGLGVSPDWRSYRTAVLTTAAWAGTMFVFNVIADTNYGYLNGKPRAASALDLFGDWPWYLLVEAIIVLTVWALITLPWTSPGRRRLQQQRVVSGGRKE